MAYKTIEVSQEGRVGIIQFDRPKALNALNSELSGEVAHALRSFEANDGIGCVIFTGSEKAFAAGADIKEMQPKGFMEHYRVDIFDNWETLVNFRKPTIAAVSGYALGGGCEVAMMCDIIIAADTAKFGQPEITLGVMPGMGGTQRLIRAVGKYKAMDMCLTGRRMDAVEALNCGLASRVVSADELMETAKAAAATIAGHSLPIAMMTKETINAAQEMSLSQGLRYERRLFQAMFTTEDQKEGMAAFAEKRKPHFRHR
ncbi:enoyl-CoA hydratase [Robiginitomaculum antarcticum]|uniref:enoyl-CoA hydratase n=1 Tax=Robiginitomaculum antarcticum TaxID=437507 RepID=UPI0003671A77|nr:enoyl-CoA hydratase [Robiginitomaculum antarcticum]